MIGPKLLLCGHALWPQTFGLRLHLPLLCHDKWVAVGPAALSGPLTSCFIRLRWAFLSLGPHTLLDFRVYTKRQVQGWRLVLFCTPNLGCWMVMLVYGSLCKAAWRFKIAPGQQICFDLRTSDLNIHRVIVIRFNASTATHDTLLKSIGDKFPWHRLFWFHFRKVTKHDGSSKLRSNFADDLNDLKFQNK